MRGKPVERPSHVSKQVRYVGEGLLFCACRLHQRVREVFLDKRMFLEECSRPGFVLRSRLSGLCVHLEYCGARGGVDLLAFRSGVEIRALWIVDFFGAGYVARGLPFGIRTLMGRYRRGREGLSGRRGRIAGIRPFM